MKKIIIFLIISVSALFAKPVVTASILPTKYFIERISGDTLDINVMVIKGADPHTYEPKPAQMKELKESLLYFAVGVEFEDVWLKKFKEIFKNLEIINTDKGIQKIAMDADHDNHADHEHGEHHHEGLDPHIWLDPVLVKTQAQNIANALIAKFPHFKELYLKNLAKFNDELNELDSFIKNELNGVKKREFITYHPSWGYFAKRYDLEQISIEIEGKEPKPAQLATLINEAKKHDIKVVFVSPQFSQKSANLIAKELNANVERIDQLPLEWEAQMKNMAKILAKSLK